MSGLGLPWRPRTLKSARGKEVTTTMTDEAAFEVVSSLSGDMARDLVSRPLKKFSHNQLVWLHVLANEASKDETKCRCDLCKKQRGETVSSESHRFSRTLKRNKRQ